MRYRHFEDEGVREAGRALTESKSTGGPGPEGAVPPSIIPGGMTGALIPTSHPLISSRLEALKTGLFETIDLKLSVGGLDVGGVMPWLQRHFFRRRTVHFTVFAQKGATGEKSVAKVFGSVTALGLSSGALELEIEGEGSAGPSPATIADRLAYEIIRLYLAEDKTNQFRYMEPSDFLRFATLFVDVAKAQRQPLLPVARSIFVKTAPDIEQIADQATLWPELNYFAGWVADNTNDTNKALLYYQRARVLFANGGKADAARQIEVRISGLKRTLAATASIEAAGTLPPSLNYSSLIRIRDGGPEGSVVGQTLATALEYQILKVTHRSEEISARWIYYAARKSEGTVQTDSGALIKDGIAALQDPGAVAESAWPYKPGEFSSPPPRGSPAQSTSE